MVSHSVNDMVCNQWISKHMLVTQCTWLALGGWRARTAEECRHEAARSCPQVAH